MPKSEPSWGRYLGLGLQIGVGVGLGLFVGTWLDRKYGWEYGAITGAMIGCASGMYLLIKDAIAMNRDDPPARRPKDGQGGGPTGSA